MAAAVPSAVALTPAAEHRRDPGPAPVAQTPRPVPAGGVASSAGRVAAVPDVRRPRVSRPRRSPRRPRRCRMPAAVLREHVAAAAGRPAVHGRHPGDRADQRRGPRRPGRPRRQRDADRPVARNGVASTAKVTARLRKLVSVKTTAGVPLFIGTDQEGGAVQVLRGPGFSNDPGGADPGHLVGRVGALVREEVGPAADRGRGQRRPRAGPRHGAQRGVRPAATRRSATTSGSTGSRRRWSPHAAAAFAVGTRPGPASTPRSSTSPDSAG